MAGIKKQAAKMVARSSRSLKDLKIGDNVAVPVSQFDRSKGDAPNVIGVIISINEYGYVVGTKSGIIRGVMARNQLESIKFCGLIEETVPDKEMTLREIVRDQSICGGQGFKKCSCLRGNCRTSRCACFKSDLLCNSACHSRRSCENNDK